jgi:hypothetical protein
MANEISAEQQTAYDINAVGNGPWASHLWKHLLVTIIHRLKEAAPLLGEREGHGKHPG